MRRLVILTTLITAALVACAVPPAVAPTWPGDSTAHIASYSFIYTEGTVPGGWSQCVVPYRLNDAEAAPGAAGDVADALAQITTATGIQFELVGATDSIPQLGAAHSPVVIAWATPSQTSIITERMSGVGGPDRLGTQYVGGAVVINADFNASYAPGFASGASRGALLLHELGHLVGLGHTEDQTQVMYQGATTAPGRYGAGDLAGLAALGHAAGCR